MLVAGLVEAVAVVRRFSPICTERATPGQLIHSVQKATNGAISSASSRISEELDEADIDVRRSRCDHSR